MDVELQWRNRVLKIWGNTFYFKMFIILLPFRFIEFPVLFQDEARCAFEYGVQEALWRNLPRLNIQGVSLIRTS